MLDVAVTSPRPGVVVVAVGGELDMVSAPMLRNRLQLLLRGAEPPACLVVDTTALAYCGSHGVLELLDAVDLATAAGVDLRIVVGPQGAVRRVLEVTGVLDGLPVHPSLAAALG
jgi:anti-sigma B factor antagonist